MNFKYIKCEIQDRFALITLNRPEVYNALSAEAKFEVIRAIRQCSKDPNLLSLVLTGEGKAFCTGQDLNDRTVKSSEENPVDLGVTLQDEWNPLVKALKESRLITIGAINGVCAGAGLSVALACDLIIAAPKTKFVSGFAKIGLCPDAGSSFIFSRALGAKKAMEFFLFNEPLLSEDMLEHKLINQIDENPLSFASSWAKRISTMAPLALEIIKKNLSIGIEQSFDKTINREIHAQRFLGNSRDYQEGLKAFFEKREPQFKGQ